MEIAEKTVELARGVCSVLDPPPKMTVSEWADERRVLPETAAYPGKWRTDRVPYAREPMDMCSAPGVRRVVLMWASQDGKSEVELNAVGRAIDLDPCPILIVQPTVEAAQQFSKERLAPMLRDSETLAMKVSDPKSRDADNTTLAKQFPGGYVVLVGSNSPTGLASRAICMLVIDEADRFEASAGDEGDPIAIAEKRTTTFGYRRRILIASSPTNKGESKIEAEYLDSSQGVWCVPCPSCGVIQPYEWGRLVFNSVRMVCAVCGAAHTEFEWKASGEGLWIHQEPDHPTKGYHLSTMASPFFSWAEMIEEWRKAQKDGPEVLRTFINTRLAETWDEGGETLDDEALYLRRETYGCDVPQGALLLTAGVDVQADRLEVEVVGWGYGAESWGIQYAVLYGDPQSAQVWEDLDAFLQRSWMRADGTEMSIWCTCVDSGYATDQVYTFTLPRTARRIFATKGTGGAGRPEVGKFTKQGKKSNVPVFPVGTDSAKDLLMSRLSVQLPEGEEHAGGYCHWPRDVELSGGALRGYDGDYFKGLTSEKRVERKAQGQIIKRWVKKSSHARNEALDCRVYASAALRIINPDWRALSNQMPATKPAAGPARRRGVLSRGVGV